MKKNMRPCFYKILDFPSSDTKNGVLGMFQNVSFDIKRVLVMREMREDDKRGGHTHHKTRQILFAINGGCTVDLDNGKEKDSVKLDKFTKGVLLEPFIWHVMRSFEPGTILLVLADMEYNEKDYIRNYDEFLRFVK